MNKCDPKIIYAISDEPQVRAAVEITEHETASYSLLSTTLLTGDNEVRINFIQPVILEFEPKGPLHEVRFFVNGYCSFSGTGSFHLGEKEVDSMLPHFRLVHRNFHLVKQTRPGHLTSALVGVLAISETSFVTLGFLHCSDYFSQIKTAVHGTKIRIIAQLQCEGTTFPGASTTSLPDIFISREKPWKALSLYADLLAKNMNSLPSKSVPNGWCTWYHYFMKIDQQEFLKNLKLATVFKPEFKIFQLDDGYEPALGVWLKTNKKFPDGLKTLAELVQAAGFLPGIWTAPFIVQKSAPVIRHNPDWILRDHNGKKVVAMWNPNWGLFQPAYALDISRPAVQEWLQEMFHTLYTYGFRFFKIDFLYGACLPGRYFQEHKTSLQIIRAGLFLIKQAIGDSILMGCGCPLEAGIGIVDSVRVGNDVTPYWSNFVDGFVGRGFELLSTKNCIRNTLGRAFMHDKLFQNDPDCLITRRISNRLSETEISTLGQVNALSGGPLMISDDLAALSQKSRDILQNTFQLHTKIRAEKRVFFSPDFMSRRMPELQMALGEQDAYLGVYNFSSQPKRHRLNFQHLVEWPRFSVRDYHDGTELALKNRQGQTDLIEPHGALLFYIKPVEEVRSK
ncbi:glycoside hydrolase family 36 protein [candidate division CSSED10-310 bacterium]|uniref:Glycoside hydrolase family 36 protein n=1 Tax=candidate division CSSED10-310 bacterium TaxID=2855610 RepID=A0ABV6YT63_UNCC1